MLNVEKMTSALTYVLHIKVCMGAFNYFKCLTFSVPKFERYVIYASIIEGTLSGNDDVDLKNICKLY